jgi:hypothetical protein
MDVLGLLEILTGLTLAFVVPPFAMSLLEGHHRRLVRNYIDARDLFLLARGREDWEMATLYLDRLLAIEHRLFGKHTPSESIDVRLLPSLCL